MPLISVANPDILRALFEGRIVRQDALRSYEILWPPQVEIAERSGYN